MENFEAEIRRLLSIDPYLPLHRAVAEIDSGMVRLRGKDNIETRAEWVLEQQMILDLMDAGKKINAIKETRAMTNLGLKEAKEAVEYAEELRRRGHMTKAQREQLEIEEREAIASILGS